MRNTRIFPIILILFCIGAVISAVFPLFGPSYIPTHDGEYHIVRIIEFFRMLSQGYVVPRWAPTLNSGFGIPIFEYHYPLPNYIGSGLIVFSHDAVRAFFFSMGLGFILAFFASFIWLMSLFGLIPALIGAVLGAYVPYWFVDIFVRGSVGEVWAIAFLFLCLYAVERKRYVLGSISFGFLILSHNILAMVFTPFLFVYMLLRNRKALLSLIAGVCLSAFFWVPALIERGFVVGLNTVNFREHFVSLYELLIPSWGTEFSGKGLSGNKISFQLGVMPVLLALFGAIGLFKEKRRDIRRLGIYFFSVFVLAIIFMFPITEKIWEILSPLQYIQYPWRLLSFVIPFTAFFGAFFSSRMKKSFWGLIVMILAVVFSYSYTRPVLYDSRNESYYLSRSNFMDGTSSMGNSFSTIWTGWKKSRPTSEVVIENGKMTKKGIWRYLEKEFTVTMDEESTVVLNTLYFPGWTVWIDGTKTPIRFDTDGTVRFIVPIGTHTIRVQFIDTWPRTVGTILSLGALVGVIGWGILSISRKFIK